MQQVQRQVFPKGRPADTAGFSDDPAATQSSVLTLDQRLDALERQVADMLRQTEENGNRLQSLKATSAQAPHRPGAAHLDTRAAHERRFERSPAAVPALRKPDRRCRRAKAKPASPSPLPRLASAGAAVRDEPAGDPGEDAYTEGFRLWEAGQYEEAITALRAFTSAYPKHRRASYANNLVGRALLDKGQPRAAAEALLANYRNNPTGERAPDSLFYLGQALMKLGQPGQACKAYAELDAVYGAKIRADLKKLET